MNTAKPLISVITVCYNDVRNLERTILSVLNQTYSKLEFIVIDGGSNDGSTDLLTKYNNKITYWISEPDEGIYDAMNKGIYKVNGDWILFMNAGDVFCDIGVLENLSTLLNHHFTFVYGNTICDFSGIYINRVPAPLDCILKYMPFSHQSVLIRSDFHKKHLYDTSLKIVADYNLLYHGYLNGEKFKYVPIDISIYEAEEGISSLDYRRRCIEYAQVHGYDKSALFRIKLPFLIIKHHIKHIVKSFMPRALKKAYYNIRLR